MTIKTKHYVIGAAVLVAAYLIWKKNKDSQLAASSSGSPSVSVGAANTIANVPNSEKTSINNAGKI